MFYSEGLCSGDAGRRTLSALSAYYGICRLFYEVGGSNIIAPQTVTSQTTRSRIHSFTHHEVSLTWSSAVGDLPIRLSLVDVLLLESSPRNVITTVTEH